MTLMALQTRAVTDGIASERLEVAMESDAPKAAVVALLLEEARAASAAAASALDGMTLMALQQRAMSSGVDAAELEAAMEASDAKARVVALIAASS